MICTKNMKISLNLLKLHIKAKKIVTLFSGHSVVCFGMCCRKNYHVCSSVTFTATIIRLDLNK